MDTLLLVLRVGLSLAVVIVLLWMAQKRWSKGSRPAAETDLQVVSRRSVGQKASVVVVDADGRRFLLGVTEHAINVLHDGPAPVAAPVAEPAFAHSMQEAGVRQDGMADAGPLPLRARHHRPKQDALSGSILSSRTWQQAGAAVRKGLNL
ncbi:flagellar biosynthetic protein FliO [Arthrobacter livingstonensis]|uniref:Flagellar protein n=1 Tax=Arthrobacter livingstonensis TaxID=670078 RepID=A0A2V5LU75_9MICC|nr:flagellar biosynthetic protein FliO [Arthrobacter livingstonensis]PYI66867.1 flagellar biosynthetic protein FliO [Arthrobacter livingstonensis]